MDLETEEQTEEVFSSGEEDTDERKHNQLLDAISSLDGKKRHKLSQRTVLSNQVSEFNFTSSKDSEGLVRLHELVGSLKENASHGDLKNQLRNITRHKKTASAPLPKHEREQIDRTTAYETTTEDVSKWDPIVKKNRQAEQLHFPLQKEDFKIVTTDQLVKRFQPRTPLERQVAELLQGSDCVIKDPDQELTPAEQRALQAMDIKEAKQRRIELMRHRALLSYKETKAKRQKKIKSKRFHKIQKKEKLKTERKQLEKLQQEDPEGYHDKLNQIEKIRAEERVSLKHRGGSKFAKKQMIYAKYDDRARQEVQDMLQKSRELTKKIEIESDSEDETFPDSGVSIGIGDIEISSVRNSDNPWMAKPSSGKKTSTFSRPTKIASHETEEENATSDYSRPKEVVNEETDVVKDDEGSSDSDDDVVDETVEAKPESGNKLESEDSDDEVVFVNENKSEGPAVSDTGVGKVGNDKTPETVSGSSGKTEIDDIFKMKPKEGKKGKDREKKKGKYVEDKKNVSKSKAVNPKRNTFVDKAADIENNSYVDDSEADVRMEVKKVGSKEMEDDDDDDVEMFNNESVNRKRTLEDFEEMLEDDTPERGLRTKKLKTDRRSEKKRAGVDKVDRKQEKEAYVDPKKLLTLESKIRQVGSLPSVVENADDEDIDPEDQQRLTIAQAFADDDVIEEFSREKDEVAEKAKPKDIDLTLPGWGSWGGEGVKVPKKKRSRFTIKAPPALPRRDGHLGHVIINESRMEAVSKHMVHEIPFPYTNAEQFEKSIRAPLGKTWNPERVHKDLTKPRVVTNLGKIIQPMDKMKVSKFQKQNDKTEMKHKDQAEKKRDGKNKTEMKHKVSEKKRGEKDKTEMKHKGKELSEMKHKRQLGKKKFEGKVKKSEKKVDQVQKGKFKGHTGKKNNKKVVGKRTGGKT